MMRELMEKSFKEEGKELVGEEQQKPVEIGGEIMLGRKIWVS